MTQPRQPNPSCPFETVVKPNGTEPHIEGRFSRLESEVSGLMHSLEAMDRSVKEGFKSVFSKIDAIGTARAANTVPWVMAGMAILSLAATVGYQAINGVSVNTARLDSSVTASQERRVLEAEKQGESRAISANLSTRITELDTKLQKETQLSTQVIESKVNSIDTKLQAEIREIRRSLEATALDANAQIIDLRKWRLDHAAQGAAQDAKVESRQEMIMEKLKGVDDRQWAWRTDRLKAYEDRDINSKWRASP